MISFDTLPHLPGCYIFKDAEGGALYIGKARDLKKRVTSYYQKQDQGPKTSALLSLASDLDFIVTNSEVEALLLENTLIKKHSPCYNIKLKDSSRYACIHLTDEKFPRICISRKAAGRGAFFGPFTSARGRDCIFSVVSRAFGLRTCMRLPKRSCLRHHLGICSGPCIGKISEEEYRERVCRAESVLKGKIGEIIAALKDMMQDCTARQQFENSLQLRDQIAALERLQEQQNMERQRKYDQDVISYLEEGGNVYLMIFKVYKGTLEGKEDYVFARNESFLEEFMVQYYSENEPPEELIVPEALDHALIEFLAHVKGKKVRATVPKQGRKKDLLDLARRNVEIGFFGDKIKLDALQSALSLPRLPGVIECFDISHLSGTSVVGSMVQFRGGRPDKHNYRRFKIRGAEGPNDLASLAEVVRRRYARLKEEKQELPDLIIVDGGAEQLAAAKGELRKLGVRTPVVSIAKGNEEVYLPGARQPLELARDEKASLFIQEMRDEAHRFALAYHRLLRKKAIMS
jgi:excinuclease ABC subunit C